MSGQWPHSLQESNGLYAEDPLSPEELMQASLASVEHQLLDANSKCPL